MVGFFFDRGGGARVLGFVVTGRVMGDEMSGENKFGFLLFLVILCSKTGKSSRLLLWEVCEICTCTTDEDGSTGAKEESTTAEDGLSAGLFLFFSKSASVSLYETIH